MRKSVLLIALAAGLCSSAAPKLNWLNPHHDFGAFREEMGPVTCTFMAVNVGDEPVVVVDARANCGCTQPRYSREPVVPGDTLRVSVSYNPSGRPGRFSKNVKVSTNTGSTAMLVIRGTVIGAPATLQSRYPEEAGRLRMSNRIVAFGETTRGRVLAGAVNIYNPTQDTIAPKIVDLPPYINMIMKPTAIPPGEQGALSLTAYTDRCDEYGLVEGSFRIIPEPDSSDSSSEIKTVMIVNEDFSKMKPEEREKAPKIRVSEQSVDFGDFGRSDGEIVKELTITNEGRSTLLIRKLSTPEKAVCVSLSTDKVKPGKSAKVTIRLNPALVKGEMLNGRLTLVANDPDHASQIIRLVGTVKKL